MHTDLPTALVTGAAGFLGSHVADALLSRGHRVVAVDDLSGGSTANVPTAATFAQGDLRNPTFVDRLFTEHRPIYIFHLAAYAAEGLSHFIKRYNYTTNLLASVNLINAAINAGNVQCFVFTSSIAVYGRNQLPMTEDLTPQPEDPYGIAKYAVELELKTSRDMFGLNSIIFRPHNVYGERQNIADPYRNVVGIFMRQILAGQELTLFGDGEQTRAFTYIGDVAPTLADSIHRPQALNETFNIGADQQFSVNDLARAVCSAMGVPFRPRYLPARREVIDAYASHAKAARLLNYHPTTSLPDGISRMAAWVRHAPPSVPTKFDQLEITKNLPPSWRV